MNIAGLIGVAIAIVVGVSLIPVVTDTVSSLNQSYSTSILNLANIIPIVFVAIIIVGAVGFIAYAVAGR